MTTAFVTVWDSVTNETSQHYVAIDFGTQKDPIINKGREKYLIHEAVCSETQEDPTDWQILQEFRPSNQGPDWPTDVLVIILANKNKDISTYAVCWHF